MLGFMPQSLSFFISTTYPPSSEPRASCFDFFFLLLAPMLHIVSGRHLSTCIQLPVRASDVDWSDAACCQSLRQHVRCQITCLFFSFFFSLLPRTDLVFYMHLTVAMCILGLFTENASSCAKWSPPMDRGALHTACVLCAGRGSADFQGCINTRVTAATDLH